jgi:hypothetical protein
MRIDHYGANWNCLGFYYVTRSIFIATIMVVTACDRDAQRDCSDRNFTGARGYDPSCHAALVFVARDSDDLLPTQVEIDRYFQRWAAVTDAEPALATEVPQVYRSLAVGLTNLRTTNPSVISAWRGRQGPVQVTGDAGFDAVMARLVEPTLANIGYDQGDGVFSFSLGTSTVFNEEILQSLLLPTSSHLPERGMAPRSEGQWAWVGATGSGTDDATADIHYLHGWGDCLSGCIFFHEFRAIVPPGGTATVYDLGGDPLELSPNTRPPPD